MLVREDMDREHHTIVVIVANASMESSNSGPLTIKDYPKDKKQLIDPMEESYVQDVLNPKSFEPSCWRKLKPSKELRELQGNDLSLFKHLYSIIINNYVYQNVFFVMML